MTTVKPYQIHSAIKLLTACGDKLEMANHPLWHLAARAASALESALIYGNHDHALLAGELNKEADALRGDVEITIGLAFRLAAAILDALRLGLLTIDRRPAPRWIGIDQAKPGTDRAGRSKHHA